MIVATYNADATLAQCIESFTNQTYANRELLVIDGDSTDGTRGILKEYGSSIDYWVSEPDKGIYDAWNKGLKEASGDWICFIGGDDYFCSPTVLEESAPELSSAYPPIRVVYGTVRVITPDGRILRRDGRPWEDVKDRFQYEMSIPHPGTYHHRSLFEVHGEFDSSFRIAGDYELLLRELKNGSARFMEGVDTVCFRNDGLSNNPEFIPILLQELKSVRRAHGISLPIEAYLSRRQLKMYITAFLVKFTGVSGFETARKIYNRTVGRLT